MYNEHPLIVRPGKKCLQTSRQVMECLLCRDCENLINKGGERYVSSLFDIKNGAGTHKILDKIGNKNLARKEGVFRGRWLQLDTKKISYFAISVFWRFSVSSEFSLFKGKLGPYGEEFRGYLLGKKGFPKNCMLMLMALHNLHDCGEYAPITHGTCFPHSGRGHEYRVHRFWIGGLSFDLYIGRVPKKWEKLCLYNGENFPIIYCHPKRIIGVVDRNFNNNLAESLEI